ncbi:MAG: hypothetical protein P4M12_06780 [Gammaproteobacteria bacterium]|nr:hypothetical protein [Gammaproteobacteria bacterium]
MNEIYFIAMPALKDGTAFNWTAFGVVVSTCASIVALVGLITTWRKILSDSKYQRSLLCLEQVKSYFANAASLLNERENNNVKWHRAIEILKMTDELKKYLADISHKHVYVIEYMNAAFSIIDVIKDINDFKFFYGVREYEDKSAEMLFKEANPFSLERHCLRIAPDTLLALSVFIDKANKVFNDLSVNDKDKNEIFSSDYFNISLTNYESVSDITKSMTLKVIYDYLSDYNQHKKNRFERRVEEQV